MGENAIKKASKKITPIMNKIKKDKKALIIVIAGVLGMLLILFSGSAEKKGDFTVEKENYSSLSRQDIKNEVQNLIESIDGAGKTQLMITYESAEESVYATDSDEKSGNNEVQIKKEHIIIENDSGETGLLIKVIYPKVQGVAVICEGGDNPLVREKIYSLLSALFDINSTSISVASMA